MVSNLGIFCVGVLLIQYLISSSVIFSMGGSILLYYIMSVSMSLRSASGFRGKNSSDKAWVFSSGEVAGGPLKGRMTLYR